MNADPVAKAVLKVALNALVFLIIGLLAVWTQHPWLFPSLGSAAFVQILTPQESSARVWQMGACQLCGIAGGYAGVYAVAARAAPVFESHQTLTFDRV